MIVTTETGREYIKSIEVGLVAPDGFILFMPCNPLIIDGWLDRMADAGYKQFMEVW